MCACTPSIHMPHKCTRNGLKMGVWFYYPTNTPPRCIGWHKHSLAPSRSMHHVAYGIWDVCANIMLTQCQNLDDHTVHCRWRSDFYVDNLFDLWIQYIHSRSACWSGGATLKSIAGDLKSCITSLNSLFISTVRTMYVLQYLIFFDWHTKLLLRCLLFQNTPPAVHNAPMSLQCCARTTVWIRRPLYSSVYVRLLRLICNIILHVVRLYML